MLSQVYINYVSFSKFTLIMKVYHINLKLIFLVVLPEK
jgi:hypothetical protein